MGDSIFRPPVQKKIKFPNLGFALREDLHMPPAIFNPAVIGEGPEETPSEVMASTATPPTTSGAKGKPQGPPPPPTSSTTKPSAPNRGVKCYRCHRWGHTQSKCWTKIEDQASLKKNWIFEKEMLVYNIRQPYNPYPPPYPPPPPPTPFPFVPNINFYVSGGR